MSVIQGLTRESLASNFRRLNGKSAMINSHKAGNGDIRVLGF